MPVALLLAVLAQTPPKSLAMPAWSVVEVSPELASFYSDHLAKELRANGFTVVTAAEIGALLSAERKKQQLGCSDDTSSCLAELANALGTDATMMVRLVKLDGGLRAHLKMLSSKDSAVLSETQIEAQTQGQLITELSGAARRLAGLVRPPSPLRTFAWATGALTVVGLGSGVTCLLAAANQYRLLELSLDRPGAHL